MVINMTQISINIDTPVVSIDEFVRRTGHSLATVRRQITSGLIPTLPREKRNEKVNINLIAYMVQCAEKAAIQVSVQLGK